MKLKKVLLRHKKLIIAGVSSVFIGMGLGFLTAPTQESYNEYLLKNNQVQGNIDTIKTNLTNKKSDFEELNIKKATLEEEQNKLIESERLAKEIQEKKAKEEADKLAKELEEKRAQEESEKLAKEEQEKKEKEEADKLAKLEDEKKAEKPVKVDNEKRVQEEVRKSKEQNNLVKEKNDSVRHSNINNSEKRNYGNVEERNVEMVWQTKSGKKYHCTNHCGKTDFTKAVRISIQQAKSRGLRPCSKCY
ncbi:MAG: cell envelope integrity protein TolA [Sarcina sp.]